MSIKLVTINIEGNRHLEERVLPFLEKENPDVICLQEVFEVDVALIKEKTGMDGVYVPISIVVYPTRHASARGKWGQLILSKLPIIESGFENYYIKDEKTGRPDKAENLPIFFENENPNSLNRAIVWLKVVERDGAKKKDKSYNIVTTHFTWSKEGKTTQLQRQTLRGLLKSLERFDDRLVLCGDFNAPRGREIFSKLAKKYKDNIPPEVITTIDNNLHYAKANINFVVDGLFSSKDYEVSDVRVVDGISDHMAIVAKVTQLQPGTALHGPHNF